MATHTKTFEQYRNDMDSTGECHYSREEFENQSDEVCYIPDLAEELDETFSYQDLKKEVEEWLNQDETKAWLEENGNGNTFEVNVQTYVNMMFEQLSWEFPSTYLAELLM